ncbi:MULTISPECIES: ABC transporter ATP-binding protein [unclassified Mesorhizobium]|uniref:ABC transporter ATP-binding protein n=1 Tax=unclassified Mesorhizobium TaxID=325217 RepID=UPI000FDB7539|nr:MULTISPECIES: ABC transporter ATP-binding protein [unclassified Mesorhizobium]TGT71842.1 ABC transporter ATP-binding protein [Mesorhizobium sp. M2E.F.Ca.ET.166.01.1.1]TGV99443.1 ABC transporter ATP-binding protein [Mesorhizobium sp. M2E.F.Ca.ET.154.01.1.1]
MDGASVSVRGLYKRYGAVGAVKGVDIEVRPGEFLSLLGPSGSGKTTLLMMIAGFEMPTAGSIRIGDGDVTYVAPNRRNIGMVFQRYALFPHMTVADNVAFPLRMRKVAKAEIARRVADALALVQLQDFGKRLPSELSGGQQQRVAVARALVFEPPVLLMDEPLGALDKKLREQMQIEIKRLQQRLGVTVIYVTHDQEEALTMSDRIAVMRNGSLEQIGSPTELYDSPATPFVAGFVGKTNFLEAVCHSCNGTGLEFGLGQSGFIYLKECPPALTTPPRPGEKMRLGVRPEAIRMVCPGDSDNRPLNGVVEAVIFVGSFRTFLVRLTGGELVHVQASTDHDMAPPSEGDRVGLTIPGQAVQIFRERRQ